MPVERLTNVEVSYENEEFWATSDRGKVQLTGADVGLFLLRYRKADREDLSVVKFRLGDETVAVQIGTARRMVAAWVEIVDKL